MKTPVSILSMGVSSPGGATTAALDDMAEWPSERVAEVTTAGAAHRVARIDLGAGPFNRWRMRPRLRRASPLSHHLMEAVAQALAARPDVDPKRVGLVGAFFIGCIAYSVRFYKGLTSEGRRFASPVLFPETVVNTPLSHVVCELGIGGPVYSQVGDTSCWISALRTASLWLANRDVEHVIVVSGEEFDPHFLDVMHAARWFGRLPETGIAEGAGALLLGQDAVGAIARITRIADGYSYRTRVQAVKAGRDCLSEFDASLPVMATATSWMRNISLSVLAGRTVPPKPAEPDFDGLGVAAAWNTIRAVGAVQESPGLRLVVPSWGLSQQIGAVEITS